MTRPTSPAPSSPAFSSVYDDLFDSRAVWLSDPGTGFLAYVSSSRFGAASGTTETGLPSSLRLRPSSLRLRPSSIRVYAARFNRFLAYLAENGESLHDIGPPAVLRFLRGLPMTADARWRYVRLLEDVFDHLMELGVREPAFPNPARVVAMTVTDPRQRKTFLTRPELPTQTATPEAEERLWAAIGAMKGTQPWKVSRDQAIVTLMLGAGLKVAEIMGVHRDRLSFTESGIFIEISPAVAAGGVRWHRTRISDELVGRAQPLLRAWLEMREREALPGPYLFMGTRQGTPMTKATVYGVVRRVMREAGLKKDGEVKGEAREPGEGVVHVGGRTLRNTFAVRELRAGADPELVGELLGHKERKSIRRYERAARRPRLLSARGAASTKPR
jgi:integrase/recombinase XerD